MKKLLIGLMALLVVVGCTAKEKAEEKVVTGTLVCGYTADGVKVAEEYAIESGVLKKYLIDSLIPYDVLGLDAAGVKALSESDLKEQLLVVGTKYGVTSESTIKLDDKAQKIQTVTTFTADTVGDHSVKKLFDEKYTEKRVEEITSSSVEDGNSCTFTD